MEVEHRGVGGWTPLMEAVNGVEDFEGPKGGSEEVVGLMLGVEGIEMDQRLEGMASAFPGLLALLEKERERRIQEEREKRERRERREATASRVAEARRRGMANLLESAPTKGDYTLVCQGGQLPAGGLPCHHPSLESE